MTGALLIAHCRNINSAFVSTPKSSSVFFIPELSLCRLAMDWHTIASLVSYMNEKSTYVAYCLLRQPPPPPQYSLGQYGKNVPLYIAETAAEWGFNYFVGGGGGYTVNIRKYNICNTLLMHEITLIILIYFVDTLLLSTYTMLCYASLESTHKSQCSTAPFTPLLQNYI
jgi:hypothetical protein